MTNQKALAPIDRLKATINMPSVQEQFRNALADTAPLFIASLIDLYGSDNYLQNCEPKEVIMEALKAATLRLPINKSLGFAFVVPFRDPDGKQRPQMQIGYKGFLQLAMRTGQYRCINADVIYEGEFVGSDRLTGGIDLSGTKKSDRVVGYFAHLETVNGFRKTTWATKDDVLAHAERFSKSFKKKGSPWQSHTDAMGIKTMLRRLLGKYGIMSVEMQQALATESDEQHSPESEESGEVIDIEPEKQEETRGPSF